MLFDFNKMNTQTKILSTIILLALSACSNEPPSPPSCRIDSRFEENISGHGACIIRLNDKLVTLRLKGNKTYLLPTNQESVNKNAQCDAHSNVWNTTGFNVEVGQFLGETRSHTRVYNCTPDASFPTDFTDFETFSFIDKDVQSIQLISPFDITPRDWKNGDELIEIRAFFNQISP